MTTHREDIGLYYRSIPIHAAEQVHEQALELLQKYVSTDKKILELGSGSGALALRLHDNGYDIVATELDTGDWQASDVKVFQLDLNTQFSEAAAFVDARYDAVMAIEVIEHLENPSLFFREAKKLLKPNGVLIFSTPNMLDLESRLKFVRAGSFLFFNREMVWNGGHISILPFWLIEELLQKSELQILERRFIGVVNFNYKQSWLASLKDFLLKRFLLRSYGSTLPADAAHHVCVAYVCRPVVNEGQ